MNPSNLSLRQKSRGTVVKTITIHPYGARDPNYIVDLTLSNLLWGGVAATIERDNREGMWPCVVVGFMCGGHVMEQCVFPRVVCACDLSRFGFMDVRINGVYYCSHTIINAYDAPHIT